MRHFSILLCFLFSGCGSYTEMSNIEQREHGLRYIKGTNSLVNGTVVERSHDGEIVGKHSFKDGQMIGDWFAVDDKGKVYSHGFGVQIKNYEKTLIGTDLTYCVLSVNLNKGFSHATLYMDNNSVFEDTSRLVKLASLVFTDYSEKYNIKDILIFDKSHEYTISKSATESGMYKVDTIPDKFPKTVFIK